MSFSRGKKSLVWLFENLCILYTVFNYVIGGLDFSVWEFHSLLTPNWTCLRNKMLIQEMLWAVIPTPTSGLQRADSSRPCIWHGLAKVERWSHPQCLSLCLNSSTTWAPGLWVWEPSLKCPTSSDNGRREKEKGEDTTSQRKPKGKYSQQLGEKHNSHRNFKLENFLRFEMNTHHCCLSLPTVCSFMISYFNSIFDIVFCNIFLFRNFILQQQIWRLSHTQYGGDLSEVCVVVYGQTCHTFLQAKCYV